MDFNYCQQFFACHTVVLLSLSESLAEEGHWSLPFMDCDSTAPIPVLLASVSRIKGRHISGYASTGILVSTAFNLSKASSGSLDQREPPSLCTGGEEPLCQQILQ